MVFLILITSRIFKPLLLHTSTVQTKLKMLFAVFSQHDIHYSFLKDFSNCSTSYWFKCLLLAKAPIDNQLLTFCDWLLLSFLLQQARSMPIGNTSLRSPRNVNTTMVPFPIRLPLMKSGSQKREREREREQLWIPLILSILTSILSTMFLELHLRASSTS